MSPMIQVLVADGVAGGVAGGYLRTSAARAVAGTAGSLLFLSEQ